jgi:hypothetical protein
MNISGLRIEVNRRVSREDVLWCYRYILKREPEGEGAITPHLKHRTFRTLVESFARSAEARYTVADEDVLWCFRHILGREPAADEPLNAHLAYKNFRELAWSFERREQGLRALTREDVIAAYRYVLRREPESEKAIEAQRSAYNFRTLVDALAASKEVTHPLTLDDVRWCFEHILGRAPRSDEDLTLYLEHKDFRTLALAFGAREGRLRAVAEDDVRWAFQHLLGREAESDEAVAPHLEHRTFRDLVETMANCNEAIRFRKEGIEGTRRRRQINHAALGNASANGTTSKLSTVATRAELVHCLFHTQTACANSKAIKASDDADEAKRVLSLFHSHGSPVNLAGKLVVLGSDCKAIVSQLALYAEKIQVYDFSGVPIKTEDATTNVALNVTFSDVDAQMLNVLPACDYLYAVDIFQHCPPPLSAALIRNALKALSPRGIAVIKLAIGIDSYTFDLAAWLAESPKSGLAPHALHEERIREIISGQGCKLVSWIEDKINPTAKSLVTIIARKSQ